MRSEAISVWPRPKRRKRGMRLVERFQNAPKMTTELDKAKRAKQRAEQDSRKREAEVSSGSGHANVTGLLLINCQLTTRLTQISSQYTATLHRLGALENLVREAGAQAQAQAQAQGQASNGLAPLSTPASPYDGFGFAPSPQPGLSPYLSPGMYPSPMLHPHFHTYPQQHHPRSMSPGTLRPASTAGGEDAAALAGAIHPGLGYGFSMPSTAGAGAGSSTQLSPALNGSYEMSSADLRRISIESSVLKRKPGTSGTTSTSRSDSASDQGSQRGDSVEGGGLGVGDISRNGPTISEEGEEEEEVEIDEDAEGNPSLSLSHPSSPSPPNASTMLLTPASADLFQRTISDGSENGLSARVAGSSSNGGSSSDLSSLNGIKVISDGDRGNVYYPDNANANGDATLRLNGKVLQIPAPLLESTNGNVDVGLCENGVDEVNGERERGDEVDEEYTPMFASLAHTPAQLVEFKRMRDDALKNKRPRASSTNGMDRLVADETDGSNVKEISGNVNGHVNGNGIGIGNGNVDVNGNGNGNGSYAQ